VTLIDGKCAVRVLTTLLAGTLVLALLCPGAAAATGGGPETLIQAYVSARHLPAGSVAGIRAGSLQTASVSGANWAIADFTPSASAAPGVQAEFQDGASTGIFRQVNGEPWRLVQIGPYGCGRDLPAGLRQAWGLPAPAICQAAATQRTAASRALAQAGAARTLGQTIAHVALGQVGVGDAPAVTSFNGVDCDPYSALVGALSPNADGCGFNTGFNLQDENEDWCSDFAKWAWQQAGVTADMSTINAGAGSFYDWGLARGETLTADGGKPAAGDAVVFFPPGRIGSPAYGDHVGIVTAVNPGGTVNLVNGDFLGKSNISVQYDTKVKLTPWAAQIWGPGEQWVLIAPPAGAQPPAPTVVISGPHAGVTGTVTSLSARGTVRGGSITQYQWTFGDGRTANQAGPDVSTIFPGTGIYPVTLTASSSLHTVVTRTWDVGVTGASSAVTSLPSDAVWYSTTPTSQYLFLPTAAGGLAAESWDGVEGSSWLQQAIPGQLGGAVTALAYPDPDVGDAMTPHAYFRSSAGTLGETYLGTAGWTTQTLAGQPEQGSALAATTQAGPGVTGTTGITGITGVTGVGPAVFYFDGAGQLSQTAEVGTGWTTSTLSGPATTDPESLALADTGSGVEVFYLAASGTLTVTSGSGSSSIPSPYGVAADSPLAAITTGAGQASVFFADTQGTLAEATQSGGGGGGRGGDWVVHELPGTTAGTALAATTDLLGSGSVGQEVFSLSPGSQPAVTSWNGQQWQTSALPGTATSILAASAYPVPGQPQQLFLSDGPAALRLDESTAPGGSGSVWTTTALPDTAATLADRVLLYAATAADGTSARAAASAAGLPARAVTESFSVAWAAALSGNYLVIAVGQAGVDALDFNQCGWADPSGEGAGGTPFYLSGEPLDRLPGVDAYENAAGTSQTPKLAADLAYYATHGALPAGVARLPARAVPQHACAGKA